MKERNLPIGIADFHSIRTLNHYYVDKTPYIQRLFDQGKYYFLSRPRRFGKSLLLDTMLELFEGNEQLFEGLDIHQNWDWKTRNPVVRVSFNADYSKPGVLEADVKYQLYQLESQYGVGADSLAPAHLYEPNRVANLLYHLHCKTGQQAVVLIDEYDKPILDAIDCPELAINNRNYLRGLYGVIKGYERYIRFAFLTGITMFSKVSLFSALNNLHDISFDPHYSSICGYTERDLKEVFALEIEGLDMDEIRHWYNGYSWRGKEKVYNPWAILNLFKSREFKPHWSITGMPSFLYKVMMERKFTPLDVDNLRVDESFISTFEVGSVRAEALLFQSGYLTIVDEHRKGIKTKYELNHPNLEVRTSFNDGYLEYLFGAGSQLPAETEQLAGLLKREDFEEFETKVRVLFAEIPYELHQHSNMAHYEGWYCSVLYACLWEVAENSEIRAQESTSRGRSDLVLIIGKQVYAIECKMLGDGDSETRASEAIAQIKNLGYADKYRDGVNTVYLIGMVFDEKERNLSRVMVETV